MLDIFDSTYLETILLLLLSGTSTLMIFTVLLYLVQKKSYMKYWALFWISTTFMFAFLFLSVYVDTLIYFGIYLWFVIIAGFFLYKGSYAFVEKTAPKTIHIVELIFALLIFFTILFPDWIGWGFVFAFFGYSIYLFLSGKVFLKERKNSTTWLGIIMIVFSVFSFIYPFIITSSWFLSHGYLLLGMLGLLMGISLFLVHFQKEKDAFLLVQSKLRYLIMHDPLTGLYNRAYMSNIFEMIIEKQETNLGLLFIDLNDFKSINDQYGHRAGDQALVSIATSIGELLDQKGDFCRFGGDEFVIILRNMTIEEVQNVQQQILHHIPTLPFELEVSLAVGMSYRNKIEQDIYDLLDQAEREMYSIKEQQKS